MLLAEIYSIDARLALLDGRYAHARSLVLDQLSHMASDPMPHKRVYWNALKVATDLANDGRAPLESLESLEVEHLKTRGNVFQAFAAYTLYVGLNSGGETAKATQLLQEYLENFRREKWPPPAHLLTSLENLVQQSTPPSIKRRKAQTLAS